MILEETKINSKDLDNFLNKIPKSKLSNNYEETINILENMFNITVTLKQLEEYYSPNISEFEEDLRLQYSHLGLV